MKRACFVLLGLVLLCTAACAKRNEQGAACTLPKAELASMQNASRGREVYPVTPIAAKGQKTPPPKKMLVDVAKSALGTPYVAGGTDLRGFDCSGFVRWAYSHFGVKLPRSASEQSRIGYSVRRDNLQAGDIVTFRDSRRGWNHVGIYVGDGKFIHSPRRNKNVVIVSMDQDYFRRTYTGARRLSTDVDDERLAEVENLIADYKQDYAQRRNRQHRSQEKAIAANTRSSKEKASTASSRRTREKDTVAARRAQEREKAAARHRASRAEETKQVRASLTRDRSEKAKARSGASASRQEKAAREKAARQEKAARERAAANKEKARSEKKNKEKQRAASSREQSRQEKNRQNRKEKQPVSRNAPKEKKQPSRAKEK
ncbi:MAG: NlpC/P60 family protein [Desulfovibrionaceae bacterium]|nr:NlpC/P60 family protein [Desulfovibrionaceae bacterium]